MRDADRLEFSEFIREFQSETDRGAALVGAALLDRRLHSTLAAFFVPGEISARLLEGGTAPLGTFAARIKATFALGLISQHELHECELIRKVRNEFAHRVHGTTFSDPKISSLCGKFQSDLPGDPETWEGRNRDKFVNAVILTVLGLTYRAEHVAVERRAPRVWPY